MTRVGHFAMRGAFCRTPLGEEICAVRKPAARR
jgi:hypothetical protein